MKNFLTFLFIIIALTSFSQTINFNLLTGTWICYKATQENKTDVTEDYKNCYKTFKQDLTYIEEMREVNTTTKGTYVLDKKNKKISFKNLITTTKYPDAKVKMDDLVFKDEWHQDQIIVSLDKDTLVILLKKQSDSEIVSDTKVFYRRKN
ncbi:MAG: hypothetical protein A2033_13685 [Bacteroidetes bacterium GWA2_31_9]|nr:MAG: hypothetical protein A2033_13685 [Bacteroidetes bacterium GWA2_31_9]